MNWFMRVPIRDAWTNSAQALTRYGRPYAHARQLTSLLRYGGLEDRVLSITYAMTYGTYHTCHLGRYSNKCPEQFQIVDAIILAKEVAFTANGKAIEPAELTAASWVPETEAEHRAIREQLDRLLTNPLFKNSRRYPSLLRYVVEHTLAGDSQHLKERTLGIEVFHRDPQYDTNLDPVVRITAGEIRKRIAQYYHEPGRDGEIRIDLPAGSYVPEFHLPAARPAALQVAAPKRRLTWIYAVAGVLMAAVLGGAMWTKPWSPRPVERFWQPLVSSPNPALLCIAPANLSAATQEAESFSASPGQLAGLGDLTLKDVQRLESQHVALSDATTLSRLSAVLQLQGKAYHVRNAAFTTFQDLREGPVILIGAFNNQWTLRLTSQLRYTFGRDPATHDSWVSDRLNPGKRDWYMATRTTPIAKLNEDYAIISRIWDATTEQFVVVAAGIGIYGTMAAGEFLTDATHLAALAKQAPENWDRKNIQVVIATRVINGISGPPRILAVHVW